METIERMLSSNPSRTRDIRPGLADCIVACNECMQACLACADACLAEEQAMSLRRCIRLNQDCADICGVTAAVFTRAFEPELGVLRAQLETCALACATCGAECQRHAHHHEHCEVCAEACRRCEEACRNLLRGFAAAVA
jgi:hypothetical protein